MKKVLLLLSLLLVAYFCIAQTPAHPNWVSFERTAPTTGTIRWSAEPSFNVSYYYLGLYPTDTVYTGPSYCDPGWNVPGGPLGSFVLEGPGVFKQDVLSLDPTKDYYAYVAAVETSGWSWAAYSSWESVTLPVELSSFTATLTASNYVTLSWTSQSETNLLGYRLYRSETQYPANSVLITPVMIQATNTSTVRTYAHEDHEVEANTSYWYWLESVDYGSSQMHGPSRILVPEGVPDTPELPETTTVGDVYPNPFRVGATINIEVNVKAGDQATLSIFNVRGQIVKTSRINAGYNQISWNGLDDNGNACSSGIYFIRVNSYTLAVSKKLLLLK